MSDNQLPNASILLGMTPQQARLLPEPRLPDGYILRGYQPGDEPGLIDLLNYKELDFGQWDLERINALLDEPEHRASASIVSYDQKIVAVTFAARDKEDPTIGSLDWVTCHPQHRGKRLGLAVCTSVLKYLVERGYERITVGTHDWRLPAIKIYLTLGFLPEMFRKDMPARWSAIMRNLGLS